MKFSNFDIFRVRKINYLIKVQQCEYNRFDELTNYSCDLTWPQETRFETPISGPRFLKICFSVSARCAYICCNVNVCNASKSVEMSVNNLMYVSPKELTKVYFLI